MAKSKRSPGKAPAPGVLVKQAHGGALMHGSADGNGGGRYKDAFIAACREALVSADGVGFVRSVMAGTTKLRIGTTGKGKAIYRQPAVRDRLQAFKILAEYSRYAPAPGEAEAGRKPVQLVLAVPNEKMANRVVKQLAAGAGGIQVAVMSGNGGSE